MDDKTIVALFFSRSENAISELEKKYGRMLYGISAGVVSSREDAEECVNDTYLAAWNSIPPAKPDSLAAYLGRVVRNMSINRWLKDRTLKRGGGDIPSELIECIPSAADAETELEGKELTAFIELWLSKQKKNDRILFVRRYWFCDSLTELSASMSKSSAAISNRLFRLRESLKSALEKEKYYL